MESRLLRINSRFKQPNESNTDFSFLYQAVNISSLQLLKFSCARLFPNIYSPFDTLIINSITYTIPTKQYTAVELAAFITSMGHPCVLTANNTFQFTNAGFLFPTKLSNRLMGFPDIPITLPATATSVPSLDGPDPIYVESADVGSNAYDSVDSNGGYIPLVWSIGCSSVPYGFHVDYEANDEKISRIDIRNGTLSNKTFNIRLTDAFGHTLVLPDTANVDLIFKVFFVPNM